MVKAVPDLAAALATTRGLLEAGHAAPIFEATFEHDGVLVRCDILEPDGAGGWRMAEVKASGRAKPHYHGDLATQLWVARSAGLPVASAAIRHIDIGFVLPPEGSHDGLFADADLTDVVAEAVAARPALAVAARAMLAGAEPATPPGPQCRSPYPCAFTDHCHAALPPPPREWPVTDLPLGEGQRWAALGIAAMDALDPATLSPIGRRVHRATVSGLVDHDPVVAASTVPTRAVRVPRRSPCCQGRGRSSPTTPGSRAA